MSLRDLDFEQSSTMSDFVRQKAWKSLRSHA
jgi:hypothetical protein